MGQFVIGQFVIGQFNKPITFKVPMSINANFHFFYNLAILLFSEIVNFMTNNEGVSEWKTILSD